MTEKVGEKSGGNPHNGWNEWSRYVLRELEELNTQVKELKTEIEKLTDRLIKVERVIWLIGGIFGIIVTPVLVWGVVKLVEVLAR